MKFFKTINLPEEDYHYFLPKRRLKSRTDRALLALPVKTPHFGFVFEDHTLYLCSDASFHTFVILLRNKVEGSVSFNGPILCI